MASYSLTRKLLILCLIESIYGVKYIDLTYSIGLKTPLWPTHRRIQRLDELDGTNQDSTGDWLASSYFTMSEHSSTHMDAPYHVATGTWTLSEIPFHRFMNITGVMIDVSSKVIIPGREKKNYAVGKEDIIEWERKNGRIPKRSGVFVRTGWGDKFKSNPVDFIGAEPKCCSFPSLGLGAAKIFADRGVYIVGVDVVSLDVGYTETFPVHGYLGGRNVAMIENAANLHLLPPKGFNLYFFPLSFEKGSGSPVRIFAIMD